jgi:hypothetical protein
MMNQITKQNLHCPSSSQVAVKDRAALALVFIPAVAIVLAIATLFLTGCASLKAASEQKSVHYTFDALSYGMVFDENDRFTAEGIRIDESNLVPGKDGMALHFNGEGTNPATDLQEEPFLFITDNPIVSGESITIEFDVKVDTVRPSSRQVDFWIVNKAGAYAVNLNVGNPNDPQLHIVLGTRSKPMAAGNWMGIQVPHIDDGQWHKIAVTYDKNSGIRRAYYDDNPPVLARFATPGEPLLHNAEVVTIAGVARMPGPRLAGPGLWGAIDNLRITDRALSRKDFLK